MQPQNSKTQSKTNIQKNPGTPLGTVSLVLSLIPWLCFAAWIPAIFALKKSKAVGMANKRAVIAIIISVLMSSLIIGVYAYTGKECERLGPGVHYEDGVKKDCS